MCAGCATINRLSFCDICRDNIISVHMKCEGSDYVVKWAFYYMQHILEILPTTICVSRVLRNTPTPQV